MKTAMVLLMAMGFSSFTMAASYEDTVSQTNKMSSQLDQVKKDSMQTCMTVKKDQKTCNDIMKSCATDQNIKTCVNGKIHQMKDTY